MKALMYPAVFLAALLPSIAFAAPAPAQEPTPVTEGESTEAGDTGAEKVEVKTFTADELYMKMSHFDAGRQGIRAFNAFTTEDQVAAAAVALEQNIRDSGRGKSGKKADKEAFDKTAKNTGTTTGLLYSLTGLEAYDIEDFKEWAGSKGCVDDVYVSPCSDYLAALTQDAQERIDQAEDSPAKTHAVSIMALADNSLDPIVTTILLHTAPTLLPEESWSDIWPQPTVALAAADGPDTDEGGYTVHEALTRDKMAERQPSDGRDWPGDDPNAEFNQDMAKGLEGLDGYVYTRDSDAAPQHGEISNATEEGFDVGDTTYKYEEFNSGEKILTTEPMPSAELELKGTWGFGIQGYGAAALQSHRFMDGAGAAGGMLTARYHFTNRGYFRFSAGMGGSFGQVTFATEKGKRAHFIGGVGAGVLINPNWKVTPYLEVQGLWVGKGPSVEGGGGIRILPLHPRVDLDLGMSLVLYNSGNVVGTRPGRENVTADFVGLRPYVGFTIKLGKQPKKKGKAKADASASATTE